MMNNNWFNGSAYNYLTKFMGSNKNYIKYLKESIVTVYKKLDGITPESPWNTLQYDQYK